MTNRSGTISNAELQCDCHRLEIAAGAAPAAGASNKRPGLSREGRLQIEKESETK